jgi:type VI secretion system protein ImpA
MNLTNLLSPIEQDLPAGKDLRQEDYSHSLYYEIKNFRNEARKIERQQIQGSEKNSRPDWASVYKLAIEATEKQTKDLEIITWLIEASLREFGFAGLRDGFKLARQVIEQFWDHLYPLPDNEGMLTRLAPLSGLNGENAEGVLIAPISLVPLIAGRDGLMYTFWHYQQAIEVMKITDAEKRDKRIEAGAVTFEMLENAAQEIDNEYFEQLHLDLLSCIDEFKALTRLLDEKMGYEAPPSSRILAQLENCMDCLKTLTSGRAIGNPSPLLLDNNEQDEDEDIAKESDNISPAPIEFKSDSDIPREQMLHSIALAADFFRRTEPHSPIPYLLDRALKWSKMPLPTLLKELIKNKQALDDFCTLTGVILPN